jgi:hypothetical protein
VRCEMSCVPRKRVLRARTIALKGPTRGTKPKAAAGGAATAAKEATRLAICKSVSIFDYI